MPPKVHRVTPGGVQQVLVRSPRFEGGAPQEPIVTDDIRPEDLELGEELEPVIRNRAPVVAVRMSPDLFARLGDYASQRNLSISEVVRQGIERLIEGASASPTTAQSSARSVARDVVDESDTDLAWTA